MKNFLMISADGHVGPRPCDYADLLEEKYRDGVEHLVEQTNIFVRETWPVANSPEIKQIVDPADETDERCKEGLWDPARRLADLERDGFVAEVLFPGDPASIGLYFSNISSSVSAEYRAAGIRAYNRWLTQFCSYAPDRLFGIAQVEPWPDMAACVQQVEQAKRDGMVAVALPRYPGIEANQPPLTDPVWEPFWAACADHDIALSAHIGHLHQQGGLLDAMVEMNSREMGFPDMAADGSIFYDPGRRPLWQMIMAGVFDRYPKLRLTFSELRTEWVSPTLSHMERRYEQARFGKSSAPLPKQRPTDYWRQNCGVAHMLKPYDVALRHQIGVENMMFGSDYPHIEGSWPNTREWLRIALKGVPEHEARLILGENAARLYKIDTAPLESLAEKSGLNPADILGDHEVPRAYIESFDFRSVFLSWPDKYDSSEIDKLMDEDEQAVLQTAQQ